MSQNIQDATEVRLQKSNDRSVEFHLKAQDVEVSVGNNLVARAILSAVGDIAGADPVLNSVSYQVTGIKLQAINESDYPNQPLNDAADIYYEDIDSEDHNQRMMVALKEAAKQWGPSSDGSLDRLLWGGQTIPVVITSFSARESATEPRAGICTADLELTHISVYIG